MLGSRLSRPAELDPKLARELATLGEEMPFPTVLGKTVCTDDFFEGAAKS